MLLRIISVFLCFLIFGCASMESIQRQYDEIKWNDGINKKEAEYIAKQYLLENPEGKHFSMTFGGIYDEDESWKVVFPSKALNPLSPYYQKYFKVFVNKQTGKTGSVIWNVM